MLVIDDGKFVEFNQATLDMLGYACREDLFSTHPSQLSPSHQPDGRSSFDKANEMIALAVEVGSHRFRWMHTRANGEEFPVEVLLTAVPFEGRTLVHVVWRDITKRVQIEQELLSHRDHLQQLVDEKTQELRDARDRAEAMSQTKSQFFSNMSHELRTPLNAIIGFSHSIREQVFGPIGNPKYSEYIDDIAASGEHLLALINDILDVSAIEAEKLELYEETLNVDEVIQAVHRMASPLATKRQVHLETISVCDLPYLVADERRLKQILLNLLSNAIKFTAPHGQVVLTVSSRSGEGHVFQVKDTGQGMTEDEIVKSMTKFGQVDRATNKDLEGTGLGLPLTQGLVLLHGGLFQIESEKGVGTTVTVSFPEPRSRAQKAR